MPILKPARCRSEQKSFFPTIHRAVRLTLVRLLLVGRALRLNRVPADPEMPFSHSLSLSTSWPGSVLIETPGTGHFRILRSREVVKRVLDYVLTAA